jgi:hypothetical protein
MRCLTCKIPVLSGEDCPQCGQKLPIFCPPPTSPNKRNDLQIQLEQVKEGHLSPEQFSAYLQRERDKIQLAREKLANQKEVWLEKAFESWGQALELCRDWLATRLELTCSSALAAATLTDECIERSVREDWEKNVETAKTLQRALLAAAAPSESMNLADQPNIVGWLNE